METLFEIEPINIPPKQRKVRLTKDEKLVKLVADFSNPIIAREVEGKCFMVCSVLQPYLEWCGIYCRLIQGEVTTDKAWYGHYWIELFDGRIIDPTASQLEGLNLPQTYLGELPKEYLKLIIL